MSDPQQPQVPPYASGAGQPPQPGFPAQPAPQPYYQGQAPQAPQGYAQPGQHYAQPSYPTRTPTPTDSNTPGKIGFILGLVGLGIGLLLSVIIQIMIRSDGYEMISVVSGVLSVLIFLADAAALAFGIIGLKRVGAPHALAGIATGLGIAGIVTAGFSFILTALSSLLYF